MIALSSDNYAGTAGDSRHGHHGPSAHEIVTLSKRFGALQVLNKISFRLNRGSFHALLGGSGAGKSTLVKCVMGYHRAEEGTVLIDNHSVEILGIADVSGNGQRKLVEAVPGQRPPEQGEIRVCGEFYSASRAEMAKFGCTYPPEEPLRLAKPRSLPHRFTRYD